MPNTYTQVHIQSVFAVKRRIALIQPIWENRLYKYITGIIQENRHKLLAINGIPDHVHVFFGMRPHQSLSYLMQDIKGSSPEWINKNKFLVSHFEWQSGYGGFSYSKSQVASIIAYVQNQKIHHRKVSFLDEYRQLLKDFEIAYDDRYIFREPE